MVGDGEVADAMETAIGDAAEEGDEEGEGEARVSSLSLPLKNPWRGGDFETEVSSDADISSDESKKRSRLN